jgi:hypothetical protein
MTMVMKDRGWWKPLALRRIKRACEPPIDGVVGLGDPVGEPILDGGLDRGPVAADRAGQFHERW